MKIKMLVMDVDGTLTDGRIYIGDQGEIMKAFHVRDGYAIAGMLPELGITPVIITGRSSRIVEIRARELKIRHLYQGVTDKVEMVGRVAAELGVAPAEIAYIGDDLNDLPAMEAVGFAACPCDAAAAVKAVCHYIAPSPGGCGAIRDCIEHLAQICKE